MSMRTNWCDHCRGEAEQGQDLLKCASKDCHKRYHLECAGLRCRPESEWSCHECSEDGGGSRGGQQLKARVRAVKRAHAGIKARAVTFFADNRQHLAPFVAKEKLATLTAPARPSWKDLSIDGTEPYVHATLRSYQVAGVNWMLGQYGLGTGGILGDEMGLGKTIQTLAFLSALKAAGLPGPHLVVTPLAVLQNWANEMKRFTPGLSFVKVHGGQSERDRLLSDPAVLGATFDVYLTTYDTLRAEEAFFTESFLFHTVTIDEGHRLKNEASSLCGSLARVVSPFRLLLTGTPLQTRPSSITTSSTTTSTFTGTPLQNNLHELWALLSYVLPGTLSKESLDTFDAAADLNAGQMDRTAVARARALLEAVMIRRVKSEVGHSPHLHPAPQPQPSTLHPPPPSLSGGELATAQDRVRAQGAAHAAAARLVPHAAREQGVGRRGGLQRRRRRARRREAADGGAAHVEADAAAEGEQPSQDHRAHHRPRAAGRHRQARRGRRL